MSYKKITIDVSVNLIFLRLQIAQDYWSQVRFTLSKTTQKKNPELRNRQNNKSSRCGKFCKLNLFIPFLYIVHDQKNLIMCSYLN